MAILFIQIIGEFWIPVPEWEGFYEVSDYGRIRSVTRVLQMRDPYGRLRSRTFTGRILRPAATKKGYRHVVLSAPGRKADIYVHHAVLRAFQGSCPAGLEVCHWDGNPANNGLVNLRYDTSAANYADTVRHGRQRGGPK